MNLLGCLRHCSQHLEKLSHVRFDGFENGALSFLLNFHFENLKTQLHFPAPSKYFPLIKSQRFAQDETDIPICCL